MATLHTWTLKQSVTVRTDRVSELEVRLPGLWWPWGAVCSLVKGSLPFTCARVCEPVQMCRWGPDHPLVQVGAPLRSHSWVSPKPLSPRKRKDTFPFRKSCPPSCMSRVSTAQRSCLFLIYQPTASVLSQFVQKHRWLPGKGC